MILPILIFVLAASSQAPHILGEVLDASNGPANARSTAKACVNPKAHMAGRGESGQTVKLAEEFDKLKIELSLDGFRLKPLWFQVNASFDVIYQFWIGDSFRPVRIRPLAGEEALEDPKAAQAGLAAWTFAGLKDGWLYTLVLTWKHNFGWTKLSIVGDQMNLTVRLRNDRLAP